MSIGLVNTTQNSLGTTLPLYLRYQSQRMLHMDLKLAAITPIAITDTPPILTS